MVASVADILVRQLKPTIEEWLRRVNLVPALTDIPLSDADRTGHLSRLYHELISRLPLLKDAESPVSAAEHGKARRAQGNFPRCSFRSRGGSKSPHSAHYISTKANSIRNRCSRTQWSSPTRWMLNSWKPCVAPWKRSQWRARPSKCYQRNIVQ